MSAVRMTARPCLPAVALLLVVPVSALPDVVSADEGDEVLSDARDLLQVRLASAFTRGDDAQLDSLLAEDYLYLEYDREGAVVVRESRDEAIDGLRSMSRSDYPVRFLSWVPESLDAPSAALPLITNRCGGGCLSVEAQIRLAMVRRDAPVDTITANSRAIFELRHAVSDGWQLVTWHSFQSQTGSTDPD